MRPTDEQRRAIAHAVRYWRSITPPMSAKGLTPFKRPAYSFAHVIRRRMCNAAGGDETPER